MRFDRAGLVAAVVGWALWAGCLPFPHFVIDQHGVRGVVRRGTQPVAGARIETCSYDTWQAPPTEPSACLVRDTLVTASDGTFQVPQRRHFELFIFGEAELPATIVAVCGPRPGELAAAKVGFEGHPPGLWEIQLTPSEQTQPILVGESRVAPEGVVEYARARCQ